MFPTPTNQLAVTDECDNIGSRMTKAMLIPPENSKDFVKAEVFDMWTLKYFFKSCSTA